MLRRILGRLGSKTPDNILWLTPTLAVGGRSATRDPRRLSDQGVRAIVDLQAETSDQGDRLASEGVMYRKVPVADFAAPRLDQLAETTDWVLAQMQADRPVFIHCRMGLGRSITFALATLMEMGYALPDAYNLVRKQRPEIALSDAQITALRVFAARQRP